MGSPVAFNLECQTQICSQDSFLDDRDSQTKENDNKKIKLIENCIVSSFNVNPSLASDFAEKIFAQQQFLNLGQAISFTASDTLPLKLVLTKQSIFCLNKKVGEGTYSNVYETVIVPTERHEKEDIHFSPGKPSVAALKATKRSGLKTAFSPEKRLLNDATKGRKQGIDSYLDTFIDILGTGYSLNILYIGNLSTFKFHNRDQPAASILKVLIGCSEGLATFHANHYIHRDIKGANILVSIPKPTKQVPEPSDDSHSSIVSDEITGVLTDFQFLMLESNTPHKTIGTVQYLDASMFGSEEESLCNQKLRRGIQTKEGDVYALGVTIHQDILINLIAQLHQKKRSPKTQAAFDITASLKHKVHQGPFSSNDLQRLSSGSNYRMIFNGYARKPNGQFGEEVYEIPQVETLRSKMNEALLKMDEFLKTEEIKCLIELANLACDMQEVDLSKRPDIRCVQTRLNGMLESLKAKMTRKQKLGIKFTLNDADLLEPSGKRLKTGMESMGQLNDEDLLLPKAIKLSAPF